MSEQAWKQVDALKDAIVHRLKMEMDFDPANVAKSLLVWLEADPSETVIDAAVGIYDAGKATGYDEGYDDAESDARHYGRAS